MESQKNKNSTHILRAKTLTKSKVLKDQVSFTAEYLSENKFKVELGKKNPTQIF